MRNSAVAEPRQPEIIDPVSEDGRLVSEEEYWRDYYELSDIHYEWNNGRLEEKPVSDYGTYLVYHWFLLLLDRFLATHPIARVVALEMGFRLALPTGVVIRKPDLAVVHNANPHPLEPEPPSYPGVFDICIEALSDTKPAYAARDTVTKKAEYAAGGVREYFILHREAARRAFYRRTASGSYAPILPQGGIIASQVLPGFHFRAGDLDTRPDLETLRDDPIYAAFVLPGWRADRERAEAEARRA
jgi:hypothetical protein